MSSSSRATKTGAFKGFYTQHVQRQLRAEFPHLLSYSRFVALIPRVLLPLAVYRRPRWISCTDISVIDSAALSVRKTARIALHHVFAADAHRGKTSVGWFYGFRLQLVVNDRGELLAFCLTLGNVDDRLSVPRLVRRLFGKLFGDRGYISQALGERSLLAHGVLLITTVRKNVRERLLAYTGKLLRRKRTLIESVNDQLKNICQIEHSRHRSPYNFLAHLLSGTGRLLPPAQEAVAALGP